MKKLILLLLLFIAFKAGAQVIVTQPYIFQKYIHVRGSLFADSVLLNSDSTNRAATTQWTKRNYAPVGVGGYKLKSDSTANSGYTTRGALNTRTHAVTSGSGYQNMAVYNNANNLAPFSGISYDASNSQVLFSYPEYHQSPITFDPSVYGMPFGTTGFLRVNMTPSGGIGVLVTPDTSHYVDIPSIQAITGSKTFTNGLISGDVVRIFSTSANSETIYSNGGATARNNTTHIPTTYGMMPSGGNFRINEQRTDSIGVYWEGDGVHNELRVGLRPNLYSPNLGGNCLLCMITQGEHNKLRLSEYGSSWNYLAFNLAEGTLASPTAVLSGHTFGRVVGVGYTGKSGAYSWAHSPEYRLIATTNWGTDYGGGHQWLTVKPGDTTQTTAMELGTDATGVNLKLRGAIITNVSGVGGGTDSLLSKNSTTNLITKIPANYYAVASAAGVSSVTGTTNRITASPTSGNVGLDISSTFEALLGKVANPLSQFASTTSSQLAGVISDETGSGALVFGTSPTLVTPALGTPSALVGTNITGTASGLNIGGNAATSTTAGTVTTAAQPAITSLGILTGLKVNGTAQIPNLTGTAGYTDFYQAGGYSHVTIGGYAGGSFAGWIQSSDGAGSATPLSINPLGGAVTFGATISSSGNTITGKTETVGDNSTKLASTAFVSQTIGQMRAHSITTPTTGATITLTNNSYNIVNPSGTLLALTVNLPSSPSDGNTVYIKYTQAITTVTYGNGTVVDGITSPVAGGLVVLVYDAGTTSWY